MKQTVFFIVLFVLAIIACLCFAQDGDYLASVDVEPMPSVEWADRAAAIDWIDNEPEAALEAIEALLLGAKPEDAQADIEADVSAWRELRLKSTLGRSDAVIETQPDGSVIVTLPNLDAAVGQ